MYYLLAPRKAPAAGDVSLTVDKPRAGVIIVRNISIYTVTDTPWSIVRGYFSDPHMTSHVVGLFHKITLKTQGITVFQGAEEWPEGWQLTISIKMQTGQNIIWTIAYEIVEPKKKGWW